jgi:BirA family transcriptional regulator, biotin operon repressor / biotin---[acetyl-CoA-carboxylase] ligase
MTAFLARRQHFRRVGSTNDVVRAWLADGTAEVCLASADEQEAGRGRDGRRWVAPPGAAVLLSLGFRPTWLAPDRAWRLAAVTSLAMADAAEAVAELPAGTVGLKWPNDLVIDAGEHGAAGAARPSGPRKVAGVLGETDGLGTSDPRVIIGIGLNAGWAAADFPSDLAPTMTSLHEATGGSPIDPARLLDAFVEQLEPRVEELRAGRFDGAAWAARQVTTGRTIRLETPGGDEVVRALGVDAASGALVIGDALGADALGTDALGTDGRRAIMVGEIRHVRMAEPITEPV